MPVYQDLDDPSIVAEGLSKRYGRRQALEDVSFTVERGQICGLLGPNGAGKTTTMRILVGISRPERGVARLLGAPSALAFTELSRAGVLIDGPAFVPHLSGRRNLELVWRAGGRRWPPLALQESLELADLGEALTRKVKSYSMGMRQRLMLAQALMGGPDVLILDEPANGLDPAEVHRLRERLIDLAATGVAILISSHILAEIELLATHVVVMNEGVIIRSGPINELLRSGTYEFEVDDLGRGKTVLQQIDGVTTVECRGGRLLVTAPERTTKELVHPLVTAGVGVDAARSARSLEDVYLALVGEEENAPR